MIFRQSGLLLFFLLIPLLSFSQTIRGIVTDANSGEILPGATVYLPETEPPAGTSTNENGRFRIDNLPPGRYRIEVSFLGYTTFADLVLVVAGKEQVLQIRLSPAPGQLQEVEVRPLPQNLMLSAEPGLRSFTIEETQRYAAAFYDPARLATSYPGVITADDQSNSLVVRGNSPAGVQWRLEGAAIVNPNHLANAGTFSDRAAPTGGGVNILSAQLLDRSDFRTGAYPAGSGNALAGIFGMNLRKGNNEKREHTVQASLLGLDLATEGPISKKNGSSYLVNYRYSTVGLLSDLGVNFGGEEIKFQDAAYHLSFPGSENTELSVYGIFGLSSTIFTPPEDTLQFETEKDRHNITYRAGMFAQGLSLKHKISNRLSLASTLNFSGLRNRRTDTFLPSHGLENEPYSSDFFQQSLLSISTSAEYYVTEKTHFTVGLLTDVSDSEIKHSAFGTHLFDSKLRYALWQPFISSKFNIGERLLVRPGLQAVYNPHTNELVAEPRFFALYRFTNKHLISIAAGLYSQPQLMQLLVQQPQAGNNNRYLKMSRSENYTAGYSVFPGNFWQIKTEAYYQKLFNIPVGPSAGSTFSALNVIDEYAPEELINAGEGENYGIELSVEKKLLKQYYLLLSSTLYNSKYSTPEGNWRDTRFDGNYAFSFTGGKEFPKEKPGKKRTFGVHLRAQQRGGFRDTPVNAQASETAQTTVYYSEQAYSHKLPAFFRADLRLSIRTDKSNSTRTLALDIQNVTRHRNLAYRYYDALQGRVVNRYQLGLIPVLSYRVDF